MNLGVVNTDNAGVPFGLTAEFIARLDAKGSAGNSIRSKRLSEPADNINFGDFNVLAALSLCHVIAMRLRPPLGCRRGMGLRLSDPCDGANSSR